MRRVLVLVNRDKADDAFVTSVERFFESRKVGLLLADYTSAPASLDFTDVDLALSMGGDGTLLFCAQLIAGLDVPILAVNLGTLGFITEVSRDEWQAEFDRYLSGGVGVSTRIMLKASVKRGGRSVVEFHGLNDAVIGTRNTPKIVRLKVVIGGTAVGRYRADGVIYATPTGSTAYSMAAGGPIVHPEMDAFILNPVSPFTLSNRPLVIPGSEVLEVEIEAEQRTDMILTVDGADVFPLDPGDVVEMTRSRHVTHIVRSVARNFYEVLKTKLNWAGEPNA